MSDQHVWRRLVLGSLGALFAIVATNLFDLQVHIGLHIMVGTARYLVAGFGGAVCTFVADYALREIRPL